MRISSPTYISLLFPFAGVLSGYPLCLRRGTGSSLSSISPVPVLPITRCNFFELIEVPFTCSCTTMSVNDDHSSDSQVSSQVLDDLMESIIVDVASECHRIARLGLDRNLENEEEELKLSAQARAKVADSSNGGEANGKYVVDIFGQTHPAVANEIFDCMNCGRSIAAGRFAPHLEKCMGKGRKARLKVTRSSTAAQNRYTRSSPVYPAYPTSTSMNRLSNGSPGVAGDEYINGVGEDL